MKKLTFLFKKIVILLVTLLIVACSTNNLKINTNYTPILGTLIEVGKTFNATGRSYDDINVEELLTNALAEELREKDLLWTGEKINKILLKCQVVEYEPGNAFKRWLFPGWGETILSIDCNFKEEDKQIGTVVERYTISAGGLYTIGGWRTIFFDIAEDIVDEIEDKLILNN